MKRSCPHCGSPIEHDAARCEYCDRIIEADTGVRAFVREIHLKPPEHTSSLEKTAGESAACGKPMIANGMNDILAARKTRHEREKDAQMENSFVYTEADALDGLMICGFDGAYPAELVIPERHNGKPVVGIGREAFKGGMVSHVMIPASVQTIGEAAFMNCARLYEVQDGTGIQTIGEDAFKGCIMLSRFPALRSGRIHACYSSFAGCYHLSLAAASACAYA